ncbi:MAG: hypothetical protein ACI828_001477 [Flavobacteriales bacterium]|jgi:hypothetical protein
MKKPIFLDPELQQQFDTDGFVKIQLLEKEDIVTLNDLCTTSFPETGSRFFSSSYLNDFEQKKEISDTISQIVQARANSYFQEFRLIGAAFLIKGIGPHSEMPMHQDWTIVDESQFYAINVWIPLTRATAANGALEVIKGSHVWNEAIRAPTLPFYFEGYQEKLKKQLTLVEASPGEAIILNQAIIHYSKANTTTTPRPALTTGLISKEAPLMLHYWNKEQPNEIELFEQEDDFLLKFEDFHSAIFERPVIGKSKEVRPYKVPSMTDAIFNDVTGFKKEKTKNIFSRLFKI